MGPGAGSPSEPTVLRDVELPEPRGEAMVGTVRVSHTAGQSQASPLWPHPRLGLDKLCLRAPSGMAEWHGSHLQKVPLLGTGPTDLLAAQTHRVLGIRKPV